PPDFAVAAAYAVARLRQLAPGASVSITDTGLSLRGAARSLADYDTLHRALAEPPLGFRIDRAEILPPTVSDFQLAVERRRDGGLVL
uniref:hypothetical protein n=1 Tax=Serratia marcescens TaxID=615 RepID=UPI001953D13F